MKRWLPTPSLSLVLLVVWVLLNQALDAGTLLLGALLAIVVPLLTQGLRPAHAKVQRPWVLLKLSRHVAVDLIQSALDVARLLLTRRTRDISSRFVLVPLEMRDPSGLALLAMILCLTPGTAWAELALDRSTLLIHVFDVDDDAAFIATIKERYERLLMEIFE